MDNHDTYPLCSNSSEMRHSSRNVTIIDGYVDPLDKQVEKVTHTGQAKTQANRKHRSSMTMIEKTRVNCVTIFERHESSELEKFHRASTREHVLSRVSRDSYE
jgi:hypothetical protein